MYKVYWKHKVTDWFKAHYPQVVSIPLTQDPTAAVKICRTPEEVRDYFKGLRRLHTVEELQVEVQEVAGGY